MRKLPVATLAFCLAGLLGACASRSTISAEVAPRWINTSRVALLPRAPVDVLLLEDRSPVQLLERHGAFAKIQTMDGRTGFVPVVVLDSEPPKEVRRHIARPANSSAAPQTSVPAPEPDAPPFRL